MKSCLLVVLLFCSYASHAMNWVKDDALSEEAVKALSLLGIKLPENLVEVNDILQKKYLTDYKEIDKGAPVLDLEGNKIPQDKLADFLNYTDKFTEKSVIDKDKISDKTIAIIPSAEASTTTNKYLLSLLKKYIQSVSGVVIFAAHEKNAKEVTDLFEKTFPDFKEFDCIIASDQKNRVKSCCEELQSIWKESGMLPYVIFTHWKPFNDVIKNTLKEGYVGSELQPFSWKERKEIFMDKNGNHPQAAVGLRNLTVTVYEHVKNLKKKN